MTIDVAVPTNRRDRETLRFHRLTLAPDETTRRDDLRVTTVERTLFDIAATGADIRRLAHEAIAKKLTSHAKLKAFAARHRGERGAPAIRRVAGEPHTRGRKERSARTTPISSGRNSGWSSNSDEEGHKTELAFEEDRARDRYYAGLGLRSMRVTERALRDETVLRQEVRRAARIVR